MGFRPRPADVPDPALVEMRVQEVAHRPESDAEAASSKPVAMKRKRAIKRAGAQKAERAVAAR
eukprot:12796824-Alexandrium_andersonii.AAC.1